MNSDENCDSPGIPVMNQPVNMMEVGVNGNNLAAAALQRHPVEVFQRRQGMLCILGGFLN
jgi:hypothetical protein